jgi:3-hydroxyisobutyrate dehydrogenase
MQRIGFLGLGTMGFGMAARLVAAGFPVTAYNRSAAPGEALRKLGGHIAASAADAAAEAHIVISMISDDAASRSVWIGERGALAAMRRGAVAVESSTISPVWARELASLTAERGCALLDAPVTGSRVQAAYGELLFLVGGDAAPLEAVRPVLQPMSRGIMHLGPNGSGALMKLINNFVCGVQVASLAEAMKWIEKSGLPADAVSVLVNGAPGSPLVKTVADRMTRHAYETFFRVDLMAKDLRYAIEEARRAGMALVTADAALARFGEAVEKGLGAKDLAAVIEALR